MRSLAVVEVHDDDIVQDQYLLEMRVLLADRTSSLLCARSALFRFLADNITHLLVQITETGELEFANSAQSSRT